MADSAGKRIAVNKNSTGGQQKMGKVSATSTRNGAAANKFADVPAAGAQPKKG